MTPTQTKQLTAVMAELSLLVDKRGKVTGNAAAEAMAIVLAAVEITFKLAKRVKALEQGQIKYLGTWQANSMYAKNSLVTHDGSVFCALQSTDSKPATDGTWQLAVKRGRDAR